MARWAKALFSYTIFPVSALITTALRADTEKSGETADTSADSIVGTDSATKKNKANRKSFFTVSVPFSVGSLYYVCTAYEQERDLLS